MECRQLDPMIAHFATTDALFYDRPSTGADEPSFSVADLDWAGWQHDNRAPWSHWHPIGLRLPDQGWKVHVSTVAQSADEVLRGVSEFCWTHRLSFKHLEGPAQLASMNAKDADRGSAGKFITVYPEDHQRLHLTLTGLDAAIGGMPGPYILSDLRWHDGPVYTRFGAFKKMWTRDDRGQHMPALRHPAGHAVEDPRTAGFTPPPWAPIPDFLEQDLGSLGDATPPSDFGYQVTRVLHYSNAGGVYEARGLSGERVVLKEGRPHAGFTPDRRDAATRVRDEEARLRTLAGPDVVAVKDAVTLHGHRFLALEYVEGTPLNAEIARRSPLIHTDSTPSDYAAYREWALRISDSLSHAVSRLHAAGYVHGDLHPRNVIVRPDGSIVLIDFEMARPATEHTTTLIGAPGFVPPDRRGGTAADRYALACIKAALFAPLTALIPLDPLKASDLLEHAKLTYKLDDAWIEAELADLGLSGSDTRGHGASPDVAGIGPAGDWDTATRTGITLSSTTSAGVCTSRSTSAVSIASGQVTPSSSGRAAWAWRMEQPALSTHWPPATSTSLRAHSTGSLRPRVVPTPQLASGRSACSTGSPASRGSTAGTAERLWPTRSWARFTPPNSSRSAPTSTAAYRASGSCLSPRAPVIPSSSTVPTRSRAA